MADWAMAAARDVVPTLLLVWRFLISVLPFSPLDKNSSHKPESGGDEPVPEVVVSGESVK